MRTTLRSLNDWSVKQTIDGYNEKYPEDRFSYHKFAEYALSLEPVKYDSGQFYNYTSMGYVLANLMIQKASGLKYSNLLEKTNKDFRITSYNVCYTKLLRRGVKVVRLFIYAARIKE